MSHYCYQITCMVKIPDERDYCPEHEPHYTTEPPRPGATIPSGSRELPHVHQFITPVVWESYPYVDEGGRPTGSTRYYAITLRCVCGEEEER